MAETTRVLITDEDVTGWYEAFESAAGVDLAEEERTDSEEVREALEAVAPRLRGRWVAEALEEFATGMARADAEGDLDLLTPASVRRLAAAYRDGTR